MYSSAFRMTEEWHSRVAGFWNGGAEDSPQDHFTGSVKGIAKPLLRDPSDKDLTAFQDAFTAR